VTIPARTGASDPTVGGAALRVYNAAGLATDDVRVALPAADWRAIGTRVLRGFRYRAARKSGDPVRSVVVTTNSISIDVRGLAWPYTLDEAAQGRVGLVLRLGATRYCAEAPANPSGKHSDRRGRFVAAPRWPAPVACPSEP
jgi:hypothetical protein